MKKKSIPLAGPLHITPYYLKARVKRNRTLKILTSGDGQQKVLKWRKTRHLWIAQQVVSMFQGSGRVGYKSLSKMTKRIGNRLLPNQLHIGNHL
jgi:hypothetical protein